jgi:hypothetical protein
VVTDKQKLTWPMIKLFTDEANMWFQNKFLDLDCNKVDIIKTYCRFSSYTETSFNLSFSKVGLPRQRTQDKMIYSSKKSLVELKQSHTSNGS